jgi:hypothetical protein
MSMNHSGPVERALPIIAHVLAIWAGACVAVAVVLLVLAIILF